MSALDAEAARQRRLLAGIEATAAGQLDAAYARVCQRLLANLDDSRRQSMTLDPTRDEWKAVRDVLVARVHFGSPDSSADEVTEAALGCPCPPEPPPEPFRKGEQMLVCSGPGRGPGEWWVSIPAYALTADEADAMAAALVEHARYAREQGDDPWRSDEEAAALVDAIKEPEFCGRPLGVVRRDIECEWQHVICQRPKGHPGTCASEDRTAPKTAPQPL